jgi:hypothetical protein
MQHLNNLVLHWRLTAEGEVPVNGTHIGNLGRKTMQTKDRLLMILLVVVVAALSGSAALAATASIGTVATLGSEQTPSITGSYVIVDTGQTVCYDDVQAIACPGPGEAFAGQDAQYEGVEPNYVDNGDGTVTDLNTGLMWQQTPGDKVTCAQAVAGAEAFSQAGYDDWRLPTLKELYSLIDFSGVDPSGWNGTDASDHVPFIDNDYFDFEYGDTSSGERVIDAQYWSSTNMLRRPWAAAPPPLASTLPMAGSRAMAASTRAAAR